MATDCSLPSWVKEKERDLSFEKVYERLAQEGQIPAKPPSKIGSENPITYGFQGVTKETNCLLQQLQGRAQGTANRIFGKLVRIDESGDGIVDATEFSRYVRQKTGGDDPELYEDDIPPLARELWKFSILYTLATTEPVIPDVGPPPSSPIVLPEMSVSFEPTRESSHPLAPPPTSWFDQNKGLVFGIGAVLVAGLFVFLSRRPIGRALGLLKAPTGKGPAREVTVRTAAPPPPSQTPRLQTPKPAAREAEPTVKLGTADVEPVTPTAPRGAQAAAPKKPPPTPTEARRPPSDRTEGRLQAIVLRFRDALGRKEAARTPHLQELVRPTPAEARPQVVTVVGSRKAWRRKNGKLVTVVIPRDQLAALRGAEQVHKPAAAVKKGVTGLIRVAPPREGTVVERHLSTSFLPWSRNRLVLTKNEWLESARGHYLELAEALEGQDLYHDGNLLAKGVHRILVAGTRQFEEMRALRELPILARSTRPAFTVFDETFLRTLKLDIARDDPQLIRTTLWSALEGQTANQAEIWALIEKLFLSV